jgi:segregation and condensation protein B
MDGSLTPSDIIANKHEKFNNMSSDLRVLEALLFAATEPVTEKSLQERLQPGADLQDLLNVLAKHYEGRGINLIRVGGKWAFRTAPDLSGKSEIEVQVARKLSRAAVETLSIIAYHQPITRAEIEEIRGVALSKGTLDLLLEIGWIKPVGRRRTPGKPVTWGTSPEFLNHFSLNEIADLPGVDELKAAGLLDKRPAKTIFGELAAHSDEGQLSIETEDEESTEPLNPTD